VRGFLRELAFILLAGMLGTVDVIFKIIKWLSIIAGGMVWGAISAIVGLGMLAEVVLTLLMRWSHSGGHMTAAQWHAWLAQFVAVEIIGLLFYGASLGGIPDMVHAARQAIRRHRLPTGPE